MSNAISRENCCSQTADGWSHFVKGFPTLLINWIMYVYIYIYSTMKCPVIRSLYCHKILSSRKVEERLTQNFQRKHVRVIAGSKFVLFTTSRKIRWVRNVEYYGRNVPRPITYFELLQGNIHVRTYACMRR